MSRPKGAQARLYPDLMAFGLKPQRKDHEFTIAKCRGRGAGTLCNAQFSHGRAHASLDNAFRRFYVIKSAPLSAANKALKRL